MPSLLDLPPNLRATTLSLALTHHSPLSLSGIHPPYHGRAATTTTTTTLTRTHLAPTQINHQLRREAVPLFYRANTFAVCLQPVYVKYLSRRKGKLREIFRRSYGDEVTALWFATLPEEVVGAIGRLRVRVACITRWEGDEAAMEREKLKAYEFAEASTRRMTEHVLYDICSSGGRVFYEVGVEGGRVEGVVEGFGDGDREGMRVDGEGEECEVCKAVLQRWVDSVEEDEGGKKCVTREKLVELVW